MRNTTLKTCIASVIRIAVQITVLSTVAHFASAAGVLSIEIQDLRKASGQLMIQLVDSEEAYEAKAEAVARKSIKVSAKGDLQTQFTDLKPGSYALMIIHDENNNGKLDSNSLGIPQEGYGFSNNPNVMRKPTFAETQFEIKEGDNQIVISMF
jgi:uncharacterized protein (DUF2141 family)